MQCRLEGVQLLRDWMNENQERIVHVDTDGLLDAMCYQLVYYSA